MMVGMTEYRGFQITVSEDCGDYVAEIVEIGGNEGFMPVVALNAAKSLERAKSAIDKALDSLARN
jgi:hypothetical protein